MQFNVTSTPQTSFGRTVFTQQEAGRVMKIVRELRKQGMKVCVRGNEPPKQIARSLGSNTVAISKMGPNQFSAVGNNTYTDKIAFDVINNTNKVKSTYRA